MTNFLYIEEMLFQLLYSFRLSFSESGFEMVKDIDVGEYGLALETIVDIIVDEDKYITNEQLNIVNVLVHEMEMDSNVLKDKLFSNRKNK